MFGQTEAISLIREGGEPVIIDDILSSSILPAAFIELLGVRSLALLPLVTARGVIGFIAAPRSTPYQWVINDVRLGLALAAQSATPIENARLSDIITQDNSRMPLLGSKRLLGVLLIGSYNPRGLREEDLGLYTTIGQQLGLALKNAQLLRSASEMEALREADRLKSGFLAAVSHDLRSPLTAIRASVESLLDRGGIQSALEQEHLLHNIASQASRLGRLVDQLLDLSRIEGGVLPLDDDSTEPPFLIPTTIPNVEKLNDAYPR